MHLCRGYLWDFDPESNFQGYRPLETRMGHISFHPICNNRNNNDDPLSFCERISDHSRNFASHLIHSTGLYFICPFRFGDRNRRTSSVGTFSLHLDVLLRWPMAHHSRISAILPTNTNGIQLNDNKFNRSLMDQNLSCSSTAQARQLIYIVHERLIGSFSKWAIYQEEKTLNWLCPNSCQSFE